MPHDQPSTTGVTRHDGRPRQRENECLALAEIFATFGVSSSAALATGLAALSTFA
jgi:hypothetical protein